MNTTESFRSLNAWLAGSPSLNLLFLFLAVTSLLASIYFFAKSQREKKPVYMMKEFLLIKDSVSAVPGLSISFDGKKIPNLSLTKVAIWNRGRETINRGDIASADRLRLDLKSEGLILGSNIAFVRRSVNDVTLESAETSVLINFDFLDHLDGAVIDVYHSGKGTLSISGTLKGAIGIRKAVIGENELPDRLLGGFITWIVRDKSVTTRKILFVLTAPLLLLLFVPLTIVEAVIQFFNVVPREYKFLD